jgi:hypothetical protein
VNERIDENELRALFEAVEPPAGLDRWRDRPSGDTGATVLALPTDRVLPLPTSRRRSVAVAAAAAVVIGLGGVVVTSQLMSDSPPADPTMTIDGPDKTVSSAPSSSTTPLNSLTAPPVTGGTGTNGPRVTGGADGGASQNTGAPPGSGGPEPEWPAMQGDPSADNTGVPVGASLADFQGDLRVTTPGQVITDLRVTGSVIVDAPDVTLRRIIVVASAGASAVRQNAGNLTVENSELTGGQSLAQGAAGLVVRRSRLESGATILSGAQVYDSYLNTGDVLVPSGQNGILLRHNVMGRATMNDLDGPIQSVTLKGNVLRQVDAPTEPGSASIHVLNNRFSGSAPSTGWNPSAPDYLWSGNTFLDSGAPANP